MFFRANSDTQVVLDCIKCLSKHRTLFSFSQVFSTYKSLCSFKAFIGMAPLGAITFVSALYADSISDSDPGEDLAI